MWRRLACGGVLLSLFWGGGAFFLGGNVFFGGGDALGQDVASIGARLDRLVEAVSRLEQDLGTKNSAAVAIFDRRLSDLELALRSLTAQVEELVNLAVRGDRQASDVRSSLEALQADVSGVRSQVAAALASPALASPTSPLPPALAAAPSFSPLDGEQASGRLSLLSPTSTPPLARSQENSLIRSQENPGRLEPGVAGVLGTIVLDPQTGLPAATGPAAAGPALVARADQGVPAAPLEAAGVVDPEVAYNDAVRLMALARYEQAQTALEELIRLFPKSRLVDDAQYWIGETLYGRGQYQQAAQKFSGNYQARPDGLRAVDNLFKLGKSLAATGNKKDACTVYDAVIKRYPEAAPVLRIDVQEEQKKHSCG